MDISVIIPAHNEERYIARCIGTVKTAAASYPGQTEIIVVCNRCTDKTAEIAASCGAVVVYNEERCIARVRNVPVESYVVNDGSIVLVSDEAVELSKSLGKLMEMTGGSHEPCDR